MINNDARLKKLKLRAWRRGFREADLILGPFADKHVSEFSEADLDWFEALLHVPDHDLYGWILEREATPPEFDGPWMNKLKAFRDQAHKAIGDGTVGNG
ncbi:MAG: succinate dehydrogenase assembly factor 2 [Alphaproteobacteria bacterium]|nr:succinate dehydrogenase assembly factor 2 [Alphaproteobacteria bacterium]MBU1513704.1 succinate dehydrogenase assembly factor 2 [Alphaproteobacteria bacterium]MBU2094651.1 succinate dehydrogenase assembly factor 2 [Alphaproteobacteria bacterium]MBU2150280.1 succinate dehydrogenase assembly factor 2 [Alphaproteobacteria bacterium]MBU2309191.1 succinate dehydrogenase assembly factor 2 [Alphaproteobacteria bacterium]